MKRGWTYQEYVASSRILFFTDSGLYFENVLSTSKSHTSVEGPALHNNHISMRCGEASIEKYPQRLLTHPDDKLRAISGILQAIHGEQTCYSVPSLTSGLLYTGRTWPLKPHQPVALGTFSSWSWLAAQGRLNVQNNHRLDGLAYWAYTGRVGNGDTVSAAWVPVPRHINDVTVDKVHGTMKDPFDRTSRECVGPAWLQGFMITRRPQWLALDCTKEVYKQRLQNDSRIFLTDHWAM
jgi:hypothetical protein